MHVATMCKCSFVMGNLLFVERLYLHVCLGLKLCVYQRCYNYNYMV